MTLLTWSRPWYRWTVFYYLLATSLAGCDLHTTSHWQSQVCFQRFLRCINFAALQSLSFWIACIALTLVHSRMDQEQSKTFRGLPSFDEVFKRFCTMYVVCEQQRFHFLRTCLSNAVDTDARGRRNHERRWKTPEGSNWGRSGRLASKVIETMQTSQSWAKLTTNLLNCYSYCLKSHAVLLNLLWVWGRLVHTITKLYDSKIYWQHQNVSFKSVCWFVD